MKLKLGYLNDTDQIKKVFLGDFFGKPTVLIPQEFKVFELETKENQHLFFKEWKNNTILISVMDSEQ